MKEFPADARLHGQLSVVIPTSGRMQELRGALDSVAESKVIPDEVILVIDSKVASNIEDFFGLGERYRDTFQKFKIVVSSGLSGPGVNRNLGLREVTNEFVAFLDDDDQFLPNKLGKQLQAMLEQNANFSFSDYYRTDTDSEVIQTCEPKARFRGDLAREIAFDSCRIATPTVMMRMSFVQKLMPLFPENMTLREDNYAWLVAATSKDFRFVYVDEALVRVNIGNVSIQRPIGARGEVRVPLLSREELIIVRLARARGLRPPWLYLTRLVAFRVFARFVKMVRKVFRITFERDLISAEVSCKSWKGLGK